MCNLLHYQLIPIRRNFRNLLILKKFHFEDLTLKNIKYKNAILNFLDKKPLNFENTTQAIPLTYLVKNGKVIHKIEGGTYATELRKLINDNL